MWVWNDIAIYFTLTLTIIATAILINVTSPTVVCMTLLVAICSNVLVYLFKYWYTNRWLRMIVDHSAHVGNEQDQIQRRDQRQGRLNEPEPEPETEPRMQPVIDPFVAMLTQSSNSYQHPRHRIANLPREPDAPRGFGAVGVPAPHIRPHPNSYF
jgi:hypothetical protein